MKNAEKILTGTCLIVLTASTSAYAACERHIYNKSQSEWNITAIAADSHSSWSETNTGNVWFEGCEAKNRRCILNPQQIVNVKYTTTGGRARGSLLITDHTGNFEMFNYTINIGQECPYIEHVGNTGSVSLNDPADGDVSIWKDQW